MNFMTITIPDELAELTATVHAGVELLVSINGGAPMSADERAPVHAGHLWERLRWKVGERGPVTLSFTTAAIPRLIRSIGVNGVSVWHDGTMTHCAASSGA